MKRLLFILFLLPLFACSQQFGFVNTETEVPPEPPGPCLRTLVSDDFPGSSLSADWTVRHPEAQTITVSGGAANIVGSGSDKDFSKRIMNMGGYGLSTIRNYVLTLEFQINAINANTRGIYVGVHSTVNNSSFRFSTYGVVDFSGAVDTLAVCATDDSIFFSQPIPRITTGLPDFNTSDTYTLTLEVREDSAITTITNVTAGTSQTIPLIYEFDVSGVWPLRPSMFYYGFGIMGSTDIDVLSFTTTTTECLNPSIVFAGNSITAGYTAGSAKNNYAYKLRANTDSLIQVMAGPGMNILNTIDNLDEIIAVGPDIVFLNIGTNAGGTFTNYQTIVTTLEAAGIDVIPLLIVNGGNPATGGTFNNSIATTYSDEIDLWTTGWNVMAGNPTYMADILHPTNAGNQVLADIIKAARPDLFPL